MQCWAAQFPQSQVRMWKGRGGRRVRVRVCKNIEFFILELSNFDEMIRTTRVKVGRSCFSLSCSSFAWPALPLVVQQTLYGGAQVERRPAASPSSSDSTMLLATLNFENCAGNHCRCNFQNSKWCCYYVDFV
jgi:hypothetical protein